MKILLDAVVHCSDGKGGDSVGLVLYPLTKVATHLVVDTKGLGRHEVLLPLDLVVDHPPKHMEVRCTREDLSRMQPLLRKVHVEEEGLDTMDAQAMAGAVQHGGTGFQDFSFAGGSSPDMVKTMAIPKGTLVVRHGIPIRAIDNTVGKAEEFSVDPQSGEITFVVLKEGHLLYMLKKEIPVPADQIDRIGEETVFLKLTKAELEQLPHE